jgi:hypothetical protein
MIHARDDYNRIQDPAGKIPEDEPVFLIRGQDFIAPHILQCYVNAAEANGYPADLIQKAREHIDRMNVWQHERAVKKADL